MLCLLGLQIRLTFVLVLKCLNKYFIIHRIQKVENLCTLKLCQKNNSKNSYMLCYGMLSAIFDDKYFSLISHNFCLSCFLFGVFSPMTLNCDQLFRLFQPDCTQILSSVGILHSDWLTIV